MALESERPDEPTAPEPSEPPAEEEPIASDEAGRSEPVGPAQTPPDEEPPAAEAPEAPPAGEAPEAPPAAEAPDPGPEEETVSVEEGRRAKPEIPGADLEVDIVPEGYDPLAGEEEQTGLEELEPSAGEEPAGEEESEAEPEPERQPSPRAVIDLASGARYRATGKRKTAVARVILRPGDGRYAVNGRSLEEHFPRPTLQRNIRQPLETVGYDARMDVVATLHGGGTMAQAGALRHGISRALIEADPNLRGELKRQGFLTRDPRVKERKKAGLKKARKRPQFSKR